MGFTTNPDGTLTCPCGNTPDRSGFDPCTVTGAVDYTLLNADSTRPVYYICNRCGQIGTTV